MISESKHLIYIINESYNADDFILDLFRQHEDMSIVLCERPHTHQSVQCSRKLMTMHLSQFAHADREVTVRPHLAFVHQQ